MAKKIASVDKNRTNTIEPVTITAVDGRKKKIKEEQEMLQKLGLYTGNIDGIAGPLTEDARRRYAAMSTKAPEQPKEVGGVDIIARVRNQVTGAIDRKVTMRNIDDKGQAYYSDTLINERDFPKYVSENKAIIARNPAYKPLTQDDYKFDKGGSLFKESMLGAGSGAATGAGIGMAVGMPWLGAGVGALVGGVGSFFSAKKRRDEETEFNTKQKKLQTAARRTSDLGEFSQYANEGQGYDVDRLYAAKGGKIQQVASNVGIAKGATHEEGGIALEGAEVEHNETVMQDGNTTKVFSDDLGYSTLANTLAKEKGVLENRLLSTVSSVEKTLGIMKRSSNKYESAGHQHKVDVLSHKADLIKNNIDSVEAALSSLFEEQQSVNGDNSNVAPSAGRSMAAPRAAGTEPVPFEKGGQIMAEDGIKLYGKGNPWGHRSGIGQAWDWTKDKASNIVKGVGDFAADKPQLTSGLLMSTGNLLSNLKHHVAAKNVKVPAPIQDKAYTAEARVNTSAQEAAINQSTASISKYVSSNVANPTVARQIMADVESRAGQTKAGVRGQAENMEAEIRRNNLANIQGVDSRNVAKQEQFLAEQHNKKMDDISRGSAISASFMGDVKQSFAQQDMADYQEMQLRLQALKDVDNVMGTTIMMAMNKGWSREDYAKYLKSEMKIDDITNYMNAYDSVNSVSKRRKK